MPATPLHPRLPVGAAVCAAALMAVTTGCAADPGERLPDGGSSTDPTDAVAVDLALDLPAATGADAAQPLPDAGPGQTEPPLAVRACEAAGAGCCPSALDFEDGTTEHFLPATCCRLALSSPQLVSAPTACGHGALKLDAVFQAVPAASMCGQPGEGAACAYTAGEVTRAVLSPLDLSGRTASVMVYLQGPALPAAPVHGSLFVMGAGGLVEGPPRALTATDVWIPVELPVPAGGEMGEGVRVLGVRLDFHGQAWTGRVFLDEVTWK